MNLYYIGSAINLASLYMLAGIGASISMKVGEFNLGGEGQIYFGGFVTAIILTSSWITQFSPFLACVIAIAASFIAGAFLSFVSGLLLYYRKADFLFTSFIVSSAVIPLIDGFVSGPFRNKTGNLLATPFIADNFRIPVIMPPSNCNLSLIWIILLCVAMWFILYRTNSGRKLCIYGISHKFAIYSGYKSKNIIYLAAICSGGMHGICGALAICGTYYTCHLGFYESMGWNAFSSALIAGGNPAFLIPSSLFMSTLVTYSNKFSMFNNFGFDMSSIIQAIVLFIVSALRRQHNDS